VKLRPDEPRVRVLGRVLPSPYGVLGSDVSSLGVWGKSPAITLV